jgi:hypothetical protein
MQMRTHTETIPATYRLKVLAQGGKKAEIEAPSSTTIGELRQTVLQVMGIQPDPNVVWFLHYRGEQLNDDGATLARIIGEHDPDKEVVLHLKKQPFAGANAPAAVAPEPTRTYMDRGVADLRERAEELAIVAVDVEGVDVFVTMMARDVGAGRERYTVRLRCTGFNLEPPSVTMVDAGTRAETAHAWPEVPGGPGAIFRPNPGDLAQAFICAPGTREWYGHGHGEFRGPEYWTLANIVEAIHFGLNSTGYRGRCRE